MLSMREKTDLLGAIVAHVIYISSILIFIARLAGKVQLEQWSGYLFLLSAFPLIYLLLKAPLLKRTVLYYIQVSLMLFSILAIFLLDYLLFIDFRQTQWMVISFVMLFFAGTGGMLGVTALAGRRWTISAVILFLIMAALSFIQRAITGI